MFFLSFLLNLIPLERVEGFPPIYTQCNARNQKRQHVHTVAHNAANGCACNAGKPQKRQPECKRKQQHIALRCSNFSWENTRKHNQNNCPETFARHYLNWN